FTSEDSLTTMACTISVSEPGAVATGSCGAFVNKGRLIRSLSRQVGTLHPTSPKGRREDCSALLTQTQANSLRYISSIIFAAANTSSSAKGRPITCTPIGRPSGERLTGTDTAGKP